MSARPLAIAAMLGSAAAWGGATVMTKGALAAFDPFVLLTLQLSASVAALWLAVALARLALPPPAPMARAGATGLIEPGLAYAVGVPGLALTTAGNAAVIAALEPVFVLFGVWLLYGTRPGATGMGAVATAVAGVALVSLPAAGGLGAGSLPGDALVLLGTALAAVYVLASSRLAPTMPALLLTALQQTAGLILAATLTAAALAAGWQALPARIDATMLALAVASGLIQYALAFWLYLVGLRQLPPGLAGVFLTLTPVFGVLGGVIFLGETVAASQLAGIALVILSLGVLLRQGGR